jgi:hypothetical protein
MSKHYRTILKFESELSKTTAELRNDTEVILDGFDGDPMTKHQLDACIEMLQDISSRMREAEPDDQVADDEDEPK